MSDPIDNFADLRRSLMSENMEPSAPIYTVESIPEDNVRPQKTEQLLCKTPSIDESAESAVSVKMMAIELDLKKARLKKEQLEKERDLINEDFNVRIQLVHAEIEMAMTKLESLHESIDGTPSNSVVSNSVPNQPGVVSNSRRLVCPSSPVLEPTVIDNRVISYAGNGPSSSMSGYGVPDIPRIPGNVVPQFLNSIGLEQLRVLDCVTLRQMRARSRDETHEVVAPGEGLVVFRVNLSIGACGTARSLRMTFIDSEVKEVMTFQHGRSGCLELVVFGQVVCFVKRPHTYFKPMLTIHDACGRPVLKVKGPSLAEDKHLFHIQTVDKIGIGSLNKRPVPSSQDYESSHTVLEFPLDLDVRYKAAVIATNFLIVDETTLEIRRNKRYGVANQWTQQNLSAGYPRH